MEYILAGLFGYISFYFFLAIASYGSFLEGKAFQKKRVLSMKPSRELYAKYVKRIQDTRCKKIIIPSEDLYLLLLLPDVTSIDGKFYICGAELIT